MVTGFSCRERRTPSGRSPTHRTGFRQPATMSQKKEWINLLELETLAQPKVDKMVHGYYSSGSESESTLRDNRACFQRYRLLPRCMVDVSRIDMTRKLFGHMLSCPLLIAPMAMQCMAHPQGELASAAAAAACGIGMVQSTMGTKPLQKVASAGRAGAAGKADPCLWFQLYVLTDRPFVRKLVLDAQKAGYQALVVTVDAPKLGSREADERNHFKLPAGLGLPNLQGLGAGGDQAATSTSGISRAFSDFVDPGLTWEFVAWVREFCSMAILVKGILSPNDAVRALEAGVDGLIVSNHGGRQLDCVPAALDMLQAINRVVGGRVPILMDGGIRRGTDMLKALGLGADAVLLGRPVLHGLALNGQQGVEDVINTLKAELRLNMALAGRPTLAHISRDLVLAPGEDLSKL